MALFGHLDPEGALFLVQGDDKCSKHSYKNGLLGLALVFSLGHPFQVGVNLVHLVPVYAEREEMIFLRWVKKVREKVLGSNYSDNEGEMMDGFIGTILFLDPYVGCVDVWELGGPGGLVILRKKGFVQNGVEGVQFLI